jgi:hypothetical protein
MKTNPVKNLPVRETSQYMREMWAAEAEHPVSWLDCHFVM